MSSDLRLRYWALRQFLFILRREHPEDVVPIVIDYLLASVLLGHVNADSFACCPLIDRQREEPLSPQAFGSPWLEVGLRSLRAVLGQDEGTSGVLHGLLRAELAHLETCERCRAFVIRKNRSYVTMVHRLQDLADGRGPEPDIIRLARLWGSPDRPSDEFA